MAHALDLSVLVEGVETEAQRGVLAAHQCDVYQGYAFGKPMDAGSFGELLNAPGRISEWRNRRNLG